jgi:hypothetical protein
LTHGTFSALTNSAIKSSRHGYFPSVDIDKSRITGAM